jgi:hypothetical protein
MLSWFLSGYLADEIECPDIVRSFLATFDNLNGLLYLKGEDIETKLTDRHYDSFSEGGRNYRIFVQSMSKGT